MRIELKFADDIPILRLSGRFIAGGDGPFLRQKLTDLIDAGSRKVIIDFEEVPYLDSTGLGFLAGSQKVAQTAGAAIVLAALNEHVKRVLETAKLVPFFIVAANEDEALAKLRTIPDSAPDGAPAALPAAAPTEAAPAAASAATPSPAKSPRGRKRAPASDTPEKQDS